MKIETTAFDSNLHGHMIHNTLHSGAYVRHIVDVYNKVHGMDAVYQSGQTGDYLSPSSYLQLSLDGGSDSRLVEIDSLCAQELERLGKTENSEEFKEMLEALKLENFEKLLDVYLALIVNESKANEYLVSLGYSDDPDDYEIDESTGYAVPK